MATSNIIMDSGISKDYLIEVGLGNIPGQSIANVTGRNASVGTVFEDIWGGGLLSTLNYDTQTGDFTPGLVITGGTSASTATIVIDDDDGTTGTLTVRDVDGIFVNDEALTDSDTGSAAVNGVLEGVLSREDAEDGEQWEAICESADDDIAGVGARTIRSIYLDKFGVTQQEDVPLNGHTAVLFTATDSKDPERTIVTSWGGTINTVWGKTNLGTIVIRDSVSKNIRQVIDFRDFIGGQVFGVNVSLDSHFTIPANTTGFITTVFTNVSKNHEADSIFLLQAPGLEGYLAAGELSVYQNSTDHNAKLSPEGLPGLTRMKFITRSNNASVDVNVSYGLLLVEDN